MKTGRNAAVLVALSVALLLTSADAFAQRGGQRGRGWAANQYGRYYNVQTVETIQGEVVAVDQVCAGRGRYNCGIHVTLETEGERLSVHLGPVWFIDTQTPKIVTGDQIEVTGSRITYEGAPALIAATVKKGDSVLTLRDSMGYPRWSGPRGRPR